MGLPMKKMKAMKVMKVMKVMKMMKKAMRVSKIAKGKMRKSVVFRGLKEKTSGGLTKAALQKNKRGKVVSKKASAHGKKQFQNISAWQKACQAARNALGITGFCAVGGKSAQGRALYAKAKSIQSSEL